MTIRRLKTLIAISEAGSFSDAAKIIHVTHAAVSQQMQALEADLGLTLFDRSKRIPKLTPLAHKIIVKARDVVYSYEDLAPSAISEGGLSGLIKLGTLRTTLTGLTPQAMAAVKAKYPEIVLHVTPGLTAKLVIEIERRNLDAAIVTKPNLIPRGLAFRELINEPMQLITAIEEPLSDPIQLLQNRPFIRFNRNAVVGTLIDNWILSKKISVKETMELDSPEAISSMVHANLGVSIVPNLAVKPLDTPAIKEISLGKSAPQRTLGLIHHENHVNTKAIDELFNSLKKVINKASSSKHSPDI